MGAANAEGMADAVQEGLLGLRQAVAWHLSANHYPPVPVQMVPVALAAIGDPDGTITLPEGVEYRGSTDVTGWQVIEAFHLDAFLPHDEDDADDWTSDFDTDDEEG